MNAVAMYYDPNFSYKNDLILNFMNFIEKFVNRNEKVEKINDKMTCISQSNALTCLFLYETLGS